MTTSERELIGDMFQRGIHSMFDVNALMTCLVDLARAVRDVPQTPATAAVRDNPAVPTDKLHFLA